MPVPQSLPTPERLLLRDSVQHRIRSAIMDGTLLPGERLHDDALIAWLGVSRTPIREALAALAQAGLVEMAANRYTRVASPSAAGRRDAFTSIGVLYGGVILLALSGASRAQQDRLARAVTSSALMPQTSADASFYQEWADATQNDQLRRLCASVTDGLLFALRVDAAAPLIPTADLDDAAASLRTAIRAGSLKDSLRVWRKLHAL